MKLPSGGKRGDVDDNGNLDFVSIASNSKGKLDIDSLTREIKTEKAMRIKREVSDGRMAVHVDDITSGMKSCKIDEERSLSDGLAGMLENLKLGDIRAEKKSVERKSQPKEVDERDDAGPRPCGEREIGRRLISDDTKVSDTLVKLEAPSFTETEENEEPEHSVHEEAETTLGERGPMLGVAANYKMEPGHNYIASKSLRSYPVQSDSTFPNMPASFPDYSCQNVRTAQGKGPKRGMDLREVHYEPQKYVRPQNIGLVEMDNLNASVGIPNSGAGNVNGKTISQVYHKQMSGGTVYASEEMLFHGDQGIDGNLEHQGSLDFQDLLDFDDPRFSIPVDTEDFLPSSGPSSLQPFGTVDQGIVGLINQASNNVNLGLHQQQWHSRQGPLPPVSTLTNSFNHQFRQQQQVEAYGRQAVQQYQEHAKGKRGSFGTDDLSDGYASDLSPSHEMQSSPMPSPQSVMDASPGTFSGSPPRTNWSPPPSNMSHCSADSGVSSPMSEDLSGYLSQKSPRQGQVASPQSMVAVPRTPHQARVTSASPPHHHQHQQLSSSHKILPQELQVAQPASNEYKSYYIDTHLAELDYALEIASKDLLEEKRRKGYPVTSLQSNNTPGTVNNTLYGTPGTINHNLPMGSNGKVGPVFQNVPATVGPVRKLDAVASANVISNPVIGGGIPTLPTTVPTSASSPGKNPVALLPVINQTDAKFTAPVGCSNNGSSAVQSLTQQAVIFKPAAPTAPPPHVNIKGKIAISPITSKPKPGQSQGQMLPLFVNTNGVVTPLLLMPPNGPSKTPPKTLRTLAPKDPVRQMEKATEISVQPAKVGNPQTLVSTTNQGDKPPNAPVQQSEKTAAGPPVGRYLNLARRLVAEMSTDDLKYRDDDGDTYLHVAVCKVDRFMVQALLERLVREKLSEMIDVQNMEGQTPLYLAVSTNHAEMVQLLIEHGADVNPFAESMTTSGMIEKTAAIHCTATKGEKYLGTLSALLKAPDINLNQVNSEGHTALICAILAHGKVNTDMVSVNSIPIIQALIRAGADPNLQVQQSGKTALMFALESRDLDLIESTFQLIEPYKLPAFLKTQAFDSSTCLKIAESLKATLDPAGQQRLYNSLRPSNSCGAFGSS